jgi:hypothetical protein
MACATELKQRIRRQQKRTGRPRGFFLWPQAVIAGDYAGPKSAVTVVLQFK